MVIAPACGNSVLFCLHTQGSYVLQHHVNNLFPKDLILMHKSSGFMLSRRLCCDPYSCFLSVNLPPLLSGCSVKLSFFNHQFSPHQFLFRCKRSQHYFFQITDRNSNRPRAEPSNPKPLVNYKVLEAGPFRNLFLIHHLCNEQSLHCRSLL